MDAPLPDEIRDQAQATWHRYLDILAPFRPALHLYCRRLTGNIWDAEDLVQETVLRGFSALGLRTRTVDKPRAYLIRIATNLWTDTLRRRAAESEALASEQRDATEGYSPTDAAEVRDAAAVLVERLAPQERAAVLMKDVFDLSLKETADLLGTTENAVKAALHRGRARLRETGAESVLPRRTASVALVDCFVARLNASDLEGLLALMLDSASVEMFPNVMEVSRGEFHHKGSWLWQAVHVHPDLPPESRPPKFLNAPAVFLEEPLMISYLPVGNKRLLTSATRFEEEDGLVARIRSYQFCPETVSELGAVLGLDAAPLPYRFPTPA